MIWTPHYPKQELSGSRYPDCPVEHCWASKPQEADCQSSLDHHMDEYFEHLHQRLAPVHHVTLREVRMSRSLHRILWKESMGVIRAMNLIEKIYIIVIIRTECQS